MTEEVRRRRMSEIANGMGNEKQENESFWYGIISFVSFLFVRFYLRFLVAFLAYMYSNSLSERRKYRLMQ